MNRRYVLKNRKRFYTFIVTLTVLLLTVSLALNVNGADDADSKATIVVRRGDTLWDIARQYGDGKDVRLYIRMIKEANKLDDDTIYAGDLLVLP